MQFMVLRSLKYLFFDRQLCDDSLDIPEPKTTDEVAQLYFEAFNIQPVKLNLSFVRTQGANIVDERPTGDSAIMFLINVLTMALGNINVRNMFLMNTSTWSTCLTTCKLQ
jgi:hypothetical protein